MCARYLFVMAAWSVSSSTSYAGPPPFRLRGAEDSLLSPGAVGVYDPSLCFCLFGVDVILLGRSEPFASHKQIFVCVQKPILKLRYPGEKIGTALGRSSQLYSVNLQISQISEHLEFPGIFGLR